jgi:hypothetical protein
MLDPVDVNPFRRVVDPVENAIITGPNAIAVVPRQLEASGRAGVPRQGTNLLYDTIESRSFELIEVLLRRGKEEEVIHGAS